MTDDDKLKQDFEKSFDVIVSLITVSPDIGMQTNVSMNGNVNYADITSYHLIKVTCCFVSQPTMTEYEWFDMRDCGHALHFIKKVHNTHTNTLELTYHSYDYSNFAKDVKDARFRRYSKQFHKQLEDILD